MSYEADVLEAMPRTERKAVPVEKEAAQGTLESSAVTLCMIQYNNQFKVGAFVHPREYSMTSEGIAHLDQSFSNIHTLKSRLFNGISIDRLNHRFLLSAIPIIPILSGKYTRHEPPIYAHIFSQLDREELEHRLEHDLYI